MLVAAWLARPPWSVSVAKPTKSARFQLPIRLAPTLKAFVRENARPGSTVVTDQHGGYIGLATEGFDHVRINHSVGEYVRDKAHTNGIESF